LDIAQGKGGFTRPAAKPVPAQPVLQPMGDNRWQVNGWRLAAAPDVKADGPADEDDHHSLSGCGEDGSEPASARLERGAEGGEGG
jgi:hypothetical protein